MLAVIALLDPHLDPVGQLVVGTCGSAGIVGWLIREDPFVRAQTLGAVLTACLVEFAGTHGLHTWEYRQHNLPGWLPGFHAAVFLSSLVVARSLPPVLCRPVVERLLLVCCGAWTVWNLFVEQTDLFGAFWFLVLIGLRRHPVIGPRIPAVVVISSAAEITGVLAGAWAYPAYDVTGMLTVGNPPSGIAGGYCFIDYCALVLGTRLLALWRRLSAARQSA